MSSINSSKIEKINNLKEYKLKCFLNVLFESVSTVSISHVGASIACLTLEAQHKSKVIIVNIVPNKMRPDSTKMAITIESTEDVSSK